MAKNPLRLRRIIQWLWAVVSNGHIKGFFDGTIYRGRLKNMCLPGLNCYSCPGSLGSCPIGAMQAVLTGARYRISFYVTGFLILMGTVFGRFICGYLCPFGLVQELLHKIPFYKKIKTFKGDKILRYAKYVILLVFVIILPLFIVDGAGGGQPWFCKWICPAGTLEGGVPLMLLNPPLRQLAGFLFTWKSVILAVTIILSIMIYRPFCKYICPLGAVYALFNKVSLYRYKVDEGKCVSCGKCQNACPMNIDPVADVNGGECVRCGKCRQVCGFSAISSGFRFGEKTQGRKDRA